MSISLVKGLMRTNCTLLDMFLTQPISQDQQIELYFSASDSCPEFI